MTCTSSASRKKKSLSPLSPLWLQLQPLYRLKCLKHSLLSQLLKLHLCNLKQLRLSNPDLSKLLDLLLNTSRHHRVHTDRHYRLHTRDRRLNNASTSKDPRMAASPPITDTVSSHRIHRMDARSHSRNNDLGLAQGIPKGLQLSVLQLSIALPPLRTVPGTSSSRVAHSTLSQPAAPTTTMDSSANHTTESRIDETWFCSLPIIVFKID